MDASWLRGALLVLFGYLLGSVPFGILVAKAFDRDVDLRKAGSGNIGATNVARTLGRGAGILTLALDAGKGILALALARQLLDPSAHHWLALVGGAVFLGHIFPVYLRFKGGKGVAVERLRDEDAERDGAEQVAEENEEGAAEPRSVHGEGYVSLISSVRGRATPVS